MHPLHARASAARPCLASRAVHLRLWPKQGAALFLPCKAELAQMPQARQRRLAGLPRRVRDRRRRGLPNSTRAKACGGGAFAHLIATTTTTTTYKGKAGPTHAREGEGARGLFVGGRACKRAPLRGMLARPTEMAGEEEGSSDPIVGRIRVILGARADGAALSIVHLPANAEESLLYRVKGDPAQAATKPSRRLDGCAPETLQCRYKERNSVMELDVPIETAHHTYCAERAGELAAVDQHHHQPMLGMRPPALSAIKYSGGKRATATGLAYLVGMRSADGHSLTVQAVDSFIALRPALTYLDEMEAHRKSTARRADSDATSSGTPPSHSASPSGAGGASQEKLRALQAHFKKRETEEQIAARLSSFAHLQRQVDEEPFLLLQHHLAQSPTSLDKVEELFSPLPPVEVPLE